MTEALFMKFFIYETGIYLPLMAGAVFQLSAYQKAYTKYRRMNRIVVAWPTTLASVFPLYSSNPPSFVNAGKCWFLRSDRQNNRTNDHTPQASFGSGETRIILPKETNEGDPERKPGRKTVIILLLIAAIGWGALLVTTEFFAASVPLWVPEIEFGLMAASILVLCFLLLFNKQTKHKKQLIVLLLFLLGPLLLGGLFFILKRFVR